MSDTNKIYLENKNIYDTYNYIIPSYMKNANSILQAKQQILNLSWEKEGEQVCKKYTKFFKFLAFLLNFIFLYFPPFYFKNIN